MATSVLQAPAHWRTLDFISDLHLHANEVSTFLAWERYMASTPCDALFILGDLFEVWVGDDVLDHPVHGRFWRECVRVIHQTSQRLQVFFMAGNRDFLVGQRLLTLTGMVELPDPTPLAWADQRWLLSHGDAMCVGDEAYQRFRQQVRHPDWTEAFLAKPLEERLALALGMRQASEQLRSSQNNWSDVDATTALAALTTYQCSRLIHGHTHQPGAHPLSGEHQRQVLSDWDATATPPRLQVLRAAMGQLPQTVQLINFQ